MSSTDPQAREAAIRQLIAVRAYELWENQGRPNGADVIHWHQAEQDVASCLAGSVPDGKAAQPAAEKKAPKTRQRKAAK